jgi:hypothetical protein
MKVVEMDLVAHGSQSVASARREGMIEAAGPRMAKDKQNFHRIKLD